MAIVILLVFRMLASKALVPIVNPPGTNGATLNSSPLAIFCSPFTFLLLLKRDI
jgi:hypothetical protein